jgi:hypothetical protein
MRDLILITAHIPDKKREDLLRNMINKLVGSDYDIMICTHTPIPIDICNNVDYVIYEKRNEILTEVKFKYSLFYTTNDFIVESTEVSPFNHCLAILSSLKLGLKISKDMGYQKVHYFEYDTVFENLNEIEENSKLLDNFSTVYYKTQIIPGYPNSPISFNLEKIDTKWFQFDYNNLYKELETISTKLVEEHEYILLENIGNNYVKNELDLSSFGVLKGLNSINNDYAWNIICVDHKNTLLFFGDNPTVEVNKIQIIVNNQLFYNLEIIPNHWSSIELINYDEINYVMIIVNGVIRSQYDFNIIDRDLFKQRNSIKNL